MPPHAAVDHFEMPVYGDEHQFATATPREPEFVSQGFDA
jgi:hypothetical protein